MVLLGIAIFIIGIAIILHGYRKYRSKDKPTEYIKSIGKIEKHGVYVSKEHSSDDSSHLNAQPIDLGTRNILYDIHSYTTVSWEWQGKTYSQSIPISHGSVSRKVTYMGTTMKEEPIEDIQARAEKRFNELHPIGSTLPIYWSLDKDGKAINVDTSQPINLPPVTIFLSGLLCSAVGIWVTWFFLRHM